MRSTPVLSEPDYTTQARRLAGVIAAAPGQAGAADRVEELIVAG